MISELKIEIADAKNLIDKNLCVINSSNNVQISDHGRKLIAEMKLDVKPMKKIKLSGNDASSLIDEMFSKIH